MRIGAIAMLPFAGLTAHGAAVNRYVDINSINPVSPYTSWETAGTDIVEVVSVANANNAGDIVHVAAGTYYLTNQIVVGNTVVTNWAGDRALTIIDGNYPAYTNRCFYLTDKNATVSGFTIRNGYTQTEDLYGMGGGVYMSGGTVRDCAIVSNVASYEVSNWRGGGGVYMAAGNLLSSDVSGNSAIAINAYSPGPTYGGGGVYAGGGLISNSTIYANLSEEGSAGGVYLRVRGSLKDCVISNNTANPHNKGYGGGGISTFRAKAIENVQIVGNTSTARGGGIFLYDASYNSPPTVVRNCLIANNAADSIGGGIYINTSLGAGLEVVENSTIVSNTATLGGGMYLSANSTTSIVNTIIYHNISTEDTDQNLYDSGNNTHAILQSCIEPGTATFIIPNAVVGPPQFVNPEAGNWRLRGASPCINTGTNRTWMSTSVDLDDGPRIRYGIVDLGAYEAERRGTAFIIR